MAQIIRQSTQIDVKVGPFLDEDDGKTPETSLTITQPDIRLSKEAGAFAQKSAAQTLSHAENGWYTVTLSATDTNTVGRLTLAIHESGALPVFMEFQVVEEAIYDALYAASATGLLPANVTQFGGSNLTASGGRPEVNVSHWRGTQPNTLVSNRVDASAGAIGNNVITTASINDGALTAAKFAAGAFDAVWSVGTRVLTAATNLSIPSVSDIWSHGTRVLTAGTNIALAKGSGVTGFNDLSAADVRTAVGLSSANLDTQLGAIPTSNPTADAIAQAVMRRDADQDENDAPLHSLNSLVLKGVSRIAFDDSGDELTVYKTDGTTAKFVQATTQGSIQPITELGAAEAP